MCVYVRVLTHNEKRHAKFGPALLGAEPTFVSSQADASVLFVGYLLIDRRGGCSFRDTPAYSSSCSRSSCRNASLCPVNRSSALLSFSTTSTPAKCCSMSALARVLSLLTTSTAKRRCRLMGATTTVPKNSVRRYDVYDVCCVAIQRATAVEPGSGEPCGELHAHRAYLPDHLLHGLFELVSRSCR